jgi:hypothetical protein
MRTCPKCGKSQTHRSRHRLRDRPAHLLFAAWYRCEACATRFLDTDWSLAALWVLPGVALVAFAGFVVGFVAREALVPSRPLRDLRVVQGPRAEPVSPVEGRATASDAALVAAAEGGDRDAQYRLGLSLLTDQQQSGRRGDVGAALRWLREAAEKGDRRAQLEVGTLYHGGIGVIQDFDEAARWMRKAAEQGEPRAMLQLGLMSELGLGMPRAPQDAYVWLNVAAARGVTQAEVARDRVRGLLSESQLREAQERSRMLDRRIPTS